MLSCVILDLDSTLVNMFGTEKEWVYMKGETRPEVLQRVLNIRVNGNFMWGAKRPHCDGFLKTCFEIFDAVGVWSAGSTPYVEEIVAELFDPLGKRPDFIWSKPDCVDGLLEDGTLRVKQKPLWKLYHRYPEFDPQKTLIIDDNFQVCEQDTLNHVHVPGFDGTYESLHTNDDTLLDLSNWMLERLPNSRDYKSLSLKGVLNFNNDTSLHG